MSVQFRAAAGITIALAAALAACGRSPAATPVPAAVSSPRSAVASGDSAAGYAASGSAELRLRAGDAVRVEVTLEPSLGGEFRVSESGSILVPPVGLIRVAGRPFAEVEAEIRAGYARELSSAELLITPMARITILGEVRQPGVFPVDPTTTIGDVLASVGGLTPMADHGAITLVRGGENIPIDLAPQSPWLLEPVRPGDRLIVGRWSWFRENLAIFVSAAASVAAAAVTTLIVR